MSLPPLEFVYLNGDFLRELKNGSPNFKPPQPVPVLRFLYELCSSVVRGDLPVQKCKAALDCVEFVEKISKADLSSSFADVVTQMAQDLTMPGESRVRLIKLAKGLVECQLVPLMCFQEHCEEEFLWEAEMIKMKAQDLKGKEVRVNTRLLYQQTKFNLLREESEGYAKLITLLCGGSHTTTENASAATVGTIKSLIGHFDLDPNRVFDIVLECFELHPFNSIFLDLIPIFPKSHASQILGFKFQYYQQMEVNVPVPLGLYQLTALLVKKDFIDLDNICAHLLPKDEEAFEHHNVLSAKRLEEVNKIGKINLAAIGKDLMEDEKQGDVTADFFAALDMESEAVAERSFELESNQILGLLIGFLSVEDWYHANILFGRLSPLNPAAHIQICDGLFRLIEKSLSPAYDTIRKEHHEAAGSDAIKATDSYISESPIDLPKELFQMLACAGPYLYRDAILLQKVCRALRGYYLSVLNVSDVSGGDMNPETNSGDSRIRQVQLKEARLRIEEALGSCLLPSLQLIPANPAVGQKIWEVMDLLPYEVRYRLYGEWDKEDERNPMVLAARQTAKLDTRRILKRLAKENLKQLGRMVAKLAHANPMTVLRTIIHQIEAYRDMITPVVDAFKYLTQLEYDVLEYVVIERLAQSGREKLKDDGLNLSDWLQSLASFWGHLCKKYPSMELRGLFQYLVNQLKRGQGIELVLVQELIQQMANVQYTENLTEEQLDAMAGGETLRYQATLFGVTRNNKALIKSTNRLRDSLLAKDEPKLAIPLLLLIAQHRSVVLINADAPYIKMVSEQFDRCHGTLLQYVEFLCSAVTPSLAYAQLIPSLNDLVHSYHLDPEVAFLIYRPVMRLFKCHGGTDTFWPLDDNETTSNSTSEKAQALSEYSGQVVLDFVHPMKSIMWSEFLETVKTMLPSKAWNSLSPDLYATFWGLTLYDLYVPRNRYESEIAKQHAALKALEELSDNSNSAIAKRKKEKERIQESLDRLISELHKHEDNVASVRRRLSREKDKWLSSCPDALKINMEFLQRCIIPRCTFSMPDAVYCAMFVHTLHSLGTLFFNTVNHIDVLICKTLQPMICCCSEYEVGRLGRFLYETLKIAYHWKSDESVYERECGNMPGFAVYYRFPNSQRVTYGQFIKVHWKWSQRITKLLIQCLESNEYMEIRNALILLTKISGVFPVTRKTGINLEKRVAKIKSDEREDLKVLATGVAAALASRKPSWVSDEEFGMGYLDLKPTTAVAGKALAGNSVVAIQKGSNTQSELNGVRTLGTGNQHPDTANSTKDSSRAKSAEGRPEKVENGQLVKSDAVNPKVKGSVIGSDAHPSASVATEAGVLRLENQRQIYEVTNKAVDENTAKSAAKISTEFELRTSLKRTGTSGSLTKPSTKQDLTKEDSRHGKATGRSSGSSINEKEHPTDSRLGVLANASMASANGNQITKGSGQSTRSSADPHASELKVEPSAVKSSELRASNDDGADDVPRSQSSRPVHSPRNDRSVVSSKSVDKQQKRASPADEPDRLSKRRRGDSESRDLEGEIRVSDRERSSDARHVDKLHTVDIEKLGNDDQSTSRATEKITERSKDRVLDRNEKEYKEKSDRTSKSRGDDGISEKSRDKSMERYGRERSVERGQERPERSYNDKAKDDRGRDEKGKDDRGKMNSEKSLEDGFHRQSLPPPPPLPLHMVPQSVSSSRRDDDVDRRFGTTRHAQRLSPRLEEKERRHSEENTLISHDDTKRRREDDLRDRKRDERESLSMKMEERDREKVNLVKDDIDAASKRRKLKREHPLSVEAGEYTPAALPLSISLSQSFDGRERGDRKGAIVQRGGYLEESGARVHGKEVITKVTRHDNDPLFDRDWDEEKRQRAELKRRHRK